MKAAATAPTRAPGRPRRPDVEARVLGAVLELLAERGVDGTTTGAVVERSGVARATVYLRWPNHHVLIAAAVRSAMGRRVIEPSGDVEKDLRRGAEQMRAILASPGFRGILPAVMAGLTEPGDDRLSFDAIAPGRAAIAREFRELGEQQGFDPGASGDVVVDLLIGQPLIHYLVTGEVPSRAAVEQAVGIVLAGLRARTDGATARGSSPG